MYPVRQRRALQQRLPRRATMRKNSTGDQTMGQAADKRKMRALPTTGALQRLLPLATAILPKAVAAVLLLVRVGRTLQSSLPFRSKNWPHWLPNSHQTNSRSRNIPSTQQHVDNNSQRHGHPSSWSIPPKTCIRHPAKYHERERWHVWTTSSVCRD